MLLILAVIVITFILIGERYQLRINYAKFGKIRSQAEKLNLEYTQLQLEYGTYSSNSMLLQNMSKNKLDLIQPNSSQIMEMK